MTLTVYHMQRSQSERVVYLCEELGLDYNLEVYPRNEVGLAPPIFKELHPVGTAPVVIDTTPSGQKIVMAESGSILEYIDKVHGQGRLSVSPTDDPARYAQYLEWLHFGSATLQANYSRMMMFTRMQMLDSGPAKFVKAKIDTCMNIYEKHFATSKYLMGDEISVADCYTVFTMTTMRGFYPLDLSPYPNVLRYLKDIGERPAYQKAMQKGDSDLEPMLMGKPKVFEFNLPK